MKKPSLAPAVEMKRMALDALHPAPYNPRKIGKAAMKGLRASLRRFGLVQPIVFNTRTGYVVGGHQRVEALRANGATEADVVIVDLDEKDERALNVTLNNPKISGDFSDEVEALLLDLREQDAAMMHELRLDALLPPENDDESEQIYATKFEVIVTVQSESEQRDLFERLKAEGHKVKVMQL